MYIFFVYITGFLTIIILDSTTVLKVLEWIAPVNYIGPKNCAWLPAW